MNSIISFFQSRPWGRQERKSPHNSTMTWKRPNEASTALLRKVEEHQLFFSQNGNMTWTNWKMKDHTCSVKSQCRNKWLIVYFFYFQREWNPKCCLNSKEMPCLPKFFPKETFPTTASQQKPQPLEGALKNESTIGAQSRSEKTGPIERFRVEPFRRTMFLNPGIF